MKCLKCGAMLLRTITGNVVDFLHHGGSSMCPDDSWEPAARHYTNIERTLVVGAVKDPEPNANA